MTDENLIEKRKKEVDPNEHYTSEYTWHLTKRKNVYPKTRKPRKSTKGTKYVTKGKLEKQRIIKEAQEKLLSFAPRHTNLYTISYWHSEAQRYLYMDVFVVHDNRLYKITKIAAKVLGNRIYEKHLLFSPRVVMAVRNWELWDIRKRDNHLAMEEKIVKELSSKMFGTDDGYFWEPIANMFAYDTIKISKQRDYRVRKNDE